MQVVLRMMDEVHNEELIKVWTKKMAPPLVTLLSAEPEVQYVALRNISLIVQRWPQILAHEVKVRLQAVHCLLKFCTREEGNYVSGDSARGWL